MAATLTKMDKITLFFNQPVWMVSFQISERSLLRNKFGSIQNLYRKGVTGTRRLKNLSNRDFFKSISLGIYSWRKETPDSFRFTIYFTLKEGTSFNERRLRWQLKRTITWNPIDVSFGCFLEPPFHPDDKIQFIKGLYGPTSHKSDLVTHEGRHQVPQLARGTPVEVDYYREMSRQ
jgi:hypothetical protein